MSALQLSVPYRRASNTTHNVRARTVIQRVNPRVCYTEIGWHVNVRLATLGF
jgi:hypothetical protein